jgi:ABC-type Fe3+/spermidine/putrescine transport system ATPase subunit
MNDDAPYLELRGLYKRFGEVEVLRDLSLELAEGEILALLGPSGSGKTTALRLLAGFETPDRGAVVVGGDEVTALAPAARGFGMVFQHYALFPHMTVYQNVAFGLESRGQDRRTIARRVDAMLELVDLGGFGARRVSEISGGQQQRVALARALAPEPRVLLLDEPLSNLDPALRERTRRELREAVREVGITTVLVTHEQEEAFHVGERVAVLHRGRLEQVGRPEELYALPESRFVATFVGRASGLKGTLASFHDGGLAAVEIATGTGGSVRWRGRRAGELAAGRPAELVARPESLRLADAGGPGTLPGRVVERRFTGALAYATVRLENAAEIEVLIDAGAGVDAGDPVSVEPRAGALPFSVFPVEDE